VAGASSQEQGSDASQAAGSMFNGRSSKIVSRGLSSVLIKSGWVVRLTPVPRSADRYGGATDQDLPHFPWSRRSGGTLQCGGARATVSGYPNGNFYQPTILTDCAPDGEIVQDKVFGPVLVATPFETVDDVLGLANDTRSVLQPEFGQRTSAPLISSPSKAKWPRSRLPIHADEKRLVRTEHYDRRSIHHEGLILAGGSKKMNVNFV
jgi:hypothetical protein